MAEFIYSTSYTRSGPWLVNAESLDKLDGIIEQEHKRMMQAEDGRRAQEARDKALSYLRAGEKLNEEELAERAKQYLYPLSEFENRRVVRLHFDDNTKLESPSIADAKRHPGIENRRVVVFELDLRYGEVECELALPKYSSDHLSLRVSPEKSATAREVFASFRDWVRSVEPRRWTRYWDRTNVWFLWFWACLISLVIAGIGATRSEPPLPAKAEAHQLLAKGITKGDESRALALLLSLESDYRPPRSTVVTTSRWMIWLLFSLGCALFICVLFSFKPKVVLGIGTGEAAIRRWRFYIRFISWTLPLWVFLNVAVPLIRGWAGLMFHSL